MKQELNIVRKQMMRRQLLKVGAAGAVGYGIAHHYFGWVRDPDYLNITPASTLQDIEGRSKGKIVRLDQAWTKARGKFTPHHQEVGDCTSHATCLGLETRAAVHLLTRRQKPGGKLSTEANYIAGRVHIGQHKKDSELDFNGVPISWGIEAARQVGNLERGHYKDFDVSEYDPELASKLGAKDGGLPEHILKLMKRACLGDYFRIDGGPDQVADMIASGNPVVIGSQVSFHNTTDKDGCLLPHTRWRWMHAMLLWGFDYKSRRRTFNCANSWGANWYNQTHKYHAGTAPGSFWFDRSVLAEVLQHRWTEAIALTDYKGQTINYRF